MKRMVCQHKRESWVLLAFLTVAAHFISCAQSQVAPPTRLRYNVVTPDSVQISWKAPKGQFIGYKLLVTPTSGGKTNQLTLQNSATKAIIQGLIPDQTYSLQIIAYSKDQESKPAQGQFRIKDIEKKKETSSKSKVKDKEHINGSKPSPADLTMGEVALGKVWKACWQCCNFCRWHLCLSGEQAALSSQMGNLHSAYGKLPSRQEPSRSLEFLTW